MKNWGSARLTNIENEKLAYINETSQILPAHDPTCLDKLNVFLDFPEYEHKCGFLVAFSEPVFTTKLLMWNFCRI